MIRLNTLSSQIDRWPHRAARYNGVYVDWFISRREKPVGPYAFLIEDYTGLDEEERLYTQDRADQMFTDDEALQFAAYLKFAHNTEVIISEEAVPIPSRKGDAQIIGVGSLAVGGNSDFHMLDREPGYSLPFPVWGYYHILDQEVVEEPSLAEPMWSDAALAPREPTQ